MGHLRLLQTFQAKNCSIEYRRIEGPTAHELFLVCRASDNVSSAAEQASALYRGLQEFLASEGAGHVVSETVFFRDIRADLINVRKARADVLASFEQGDEISAVTEIEQPPATPHSLVEVLAHVIVDDRSNATGVHDGNVNACSCEECARMRALRIEIGEERRLYAGNIFGGGDDAYEQTLAMFNSAEVLLQEAGMSFREVMRTWIYFSEMERDYDGFNRARREFFNAHGIEPVPASTGIGAGMAAPDHDICLGFYACTGASPTARTVMKTPTLNEAPEYGSDFSRGMRVEETNRTSLYVSGTASLDETGRTVHLGNTGNQADRMLVNVAGLLEQQGATFSDIVYAITYIKDPDDVAILTRKFSEAGYQGFPNVIVEAPVCRPELLCETELLALVPAVDA